MFKCITLCVVCAAQVNRFSLRERAQAKELKQESFQERKLKRESLRERAQKRELKIEKAQARDLKQKSLSKRA